MQIFVEAPTIKARINAEFKPELYDNLPSDSDKNYLKKLGIARRRFWRSILKIIKIYSRVDGVEFLVGGDAIKVQYILDQITAELESAK